MLICFGIFSYKFLKHSSDVSIHSSDVIIHVFNIIVTFFSHGFDVIMNVVKCIFYSKGEVGELVGTIASESLYVMELERVFPEVVIVRNIYWLILLCDF